MNKQLFHNFQCRLEHEISKLRVRKEVKNKVFIFISKDIESLKIIPLLLEEAVIYIDDEQQINVSVGTRDYRFDPRGEIVFLGMYLLSINKERYRLEKKIYNEVEEQRETDKGISSIIDEVARVNNLSNVQVLLMYSKHIQRNKLK